MSTEFYWVAVVLTTIVSVARLTRLVTWDDFPPIKYLRDKYADRTDGSGWQLLAFCGYCASFWIAWIVVAWGIGANVYGTPPDSATEDWWFASWWAVNGIFAVSYLAAVFMAHDGDDGDDD